MQGFVFVSNKKRNIPLPHETIKNSINKLKGINHKFKIISDEHLTLVYYTNEYERYPYETNDSFLACPIGQFTEERNLLVQNLSSKDNIGKRKIVSDLAGTFLIALGDLRQNKIDIFTHITRIESAYSYESEDIIIVGSDPIIISALSNKKMKPEFDSKNFIAFFEMGYFADESTPFKNVVCLPPNSHIMIESGSMKIKEIDNSYSNIFKEELTEDFNKVLTTAFLDSFDIIPSSSLINLGLTGGKDSRMIFYALLNKGYNLETFTSGFPENPDVIIADELANFYGIKHTVKNPVLNESTALDIHLEQRLVDSMVSTSGQIYAYENIHPLSHFKKNITVNGVAGEVLRGGYIIPENFSSKTDKNKLINKFYRYPEMYNQIDSKYLSHLQKLNNNHEDYLVNLYNHYLNYKCGRWSSDSRKGKGYLADNYMPFLDNQFVKLIMKVAPEELYSGKLQFNLLKSLDEQAVNFRFETTRFNFEKMFPLQNDYKGWYNRRPIYPTSKIGKYNWRVLANGQKSLINSFREILLTDKANPIYNVVDISNLDKLLSSNINYKYGRFIWALASMSTFINYINNNDIIDFKQSIKVDIPSDKVKVINPKIKLFDLNSKFIPLNDSLTVEQKENLGEVLIKTKKSEKNNYLKTFKGKFQDIPSNDEEASLKNIKSMRVNITMHITNEELILNILLYSKNQRKRNVKIKPELKKNRLVFDKEINIDEEISSYRLALKFPNKDMEREYLIEYAFVEMFSNDMT